MILCAGLGTRLKPWTFEHPKALVPVGGVPMIKRVAERLIGMGFDDLTINVHHFADQIIEYIEEGNIEGCNIHISDETECLLDTGGGILFAEQFLAQDSRPFLVHNVDILSDADLKLLYDRHVESVNDVTLLVSDRATDRKLVFDSDMVLKGWINRKSGETRPANLEVEESDKVLAFSGIYVMSPSVFGKMKTAGFNRKFPIMDFFLAGLDDVRIGCVCCPGMTIIDIGKPETLEKAREMLS